MAILLREVANSGSVTDHALDAVGQIQVTEGSTYSLIDQDTQLPIEDVVLKREGDRLEIKIEGEIEGESDTLVSLEGFYANDADASFSDGSSLLSTTAVTGEAIWAASDIDSNTPLLAGAGLAAGGLGLAGAGGGGAAAVGIASIAGAAEIVEVAANIVKVAAAAGPFITTMGVEIYDANGNLLQALEHDFSTGSVDVEIGGYTGAILIKVIDINGDAADYLDEATNTELSLGTHALRAMVATDAAGNTSVSVTPLTELAARIAGVTEDNVVTEDNIAINDQVADLFGVTDILGDVTTIVDANYNSTDGLDDAETYGAVLASLSGVDSISGGVEQTLVIFAEAATETEDGTLVFSEAVMDLIVLGAQDLSENPAFPPTTTISGIDISADTGTSDSDFLTNTAAQTITAILSEALAEGEVLHGSADGGVTWEEITSSISSGTSISWTTNISAGSIQFRVDDAEGNRGPVSSRAYTLDTTAPSIIAVVVTNFSLVEVIFSEGLADSTLDAGAFSIAVNGETYSFISGTVSGPIVTLVPSQDIYASDAVTALNFSGSIGNVVDAAGNAAGTVTFGPVTNSSIGIALKFEQTFSKLTGSGDLTINQFDGPGNDLLLVDIFEGATTNYIHNLDINQYGLGGNDDIYATLEAQFIGADTYSSDTGNAIEMDGGADDDMLAVNFFANDIETSNNAFVEILFNDISLMGGTGSDALSVAFNAAAVASSAYATAQINNNHLLLDGGADDDMLSIGLIASALTITGTDDAYATIGSNDIFALGGDGIDTLNILLSANADLANPYIYASASAGVKYNDISASGEHIDIDLQAQAYGNSEVSAYISGNDIKVTVDSFAQVDLFVTATGVSYYSITGDILNNNIDIKGSQGSDTLNVNMFADVDGQFDEGIWAGIRQNLVHLEGAAGDDNLAIILDANGAGAYTGTSGGEPSNFANASAYIYSNRAGYTSESSLTSPVGLSAFGGSGNDLISFDLDAVAYGETGAWAKNYLNHIFAQGSSGNDTLIAAVNATATALSGRATAYVGGYSSWSDVGQGNDIYLMGGDGFDTVDVDLYAHAQASTWNADAYLSHNMVSASGEVVHINLTADANGLSVTASEAANARAYNSNNEVNIYGGAANDVLNVALNADASAIDSAVANVGAGTYGSYENSSDSGNDIAVFGGEGTDSIGISLVALAQGSNAKANVFGKWIEASGETVDINLTASAHASSAATYASAVVAGNDIEVFGDTGADTLNVQLFASANVGSESATAFNIARAHVADNFVHLNGGDGADHLTAGLNASASASNTGGGSPAISYASIVSNVLLIEGGAGADTINLNMDAQRVSDNIALIRAGEGADTINLDIGASSNYSNYISIYYGDFSHLGDNINGLGSSSSENDIQFNFHSDAFTAASNTVSGSNIHASQFTSGNDIANATTGADSNDYFYYDINDQALYYDADGSGTGAAATLVAQFDTEFSGLDYRDIHIAGSSVVNLSYISGTSSILQFGASHDDYLSAGFQDTSYGDLSGIELGQYAFGGSDSLVALFDASVSDSSGAVVSYNTVEQNAGSGDDYINLTMNAFSSYDSSITAAVGNNYLSIDGGGGDDQIYVSLSAQATSATYYADARVKYNELEILGGTGSDNISVYVTASATDASYYSALAAITYNSIFVDGGDGGARIDISMDAIAKDASSAYARISDNDFTIFGGSGNDTVTVDLQALASSAYDTAGAFVVSNSIEIHGNAGGEYINAHLHATGGSVTYYSALAFVSWNSLDLYAGQGNDTISATLSANAFGANSSSAELYYNDLLLQGSEGADHIYLNMYANAGVTGSTNNTAVAAINSNYATIYGGADDDSIVVDIRANAIGDTALVNAGVNYNTNSNTYTTTTTIPSSPYTIITTLSSPTTSTTTSFFGSNQLAIYGGSGLDAIDVNLGADARGQRQAQAVLYDNNIDLYADVSGYGASGSSAPVSGTEMLSLDLLASASANAGAVTSQSASARALVLSNSVDIYGGSAMDSIDLNITAAALAVGATGDGVFIADAYAGISNNTFNLYGNAGADSLHLDLKVSASAMSADTNMASSSIINNSIYMEGGTGNDSLALSINAGFAMDNNTISFDGGSGNDTINLAIQAENMASNDIFIRGGKGADIFNLNTLSVGSSFNDTFYFDYHGADEFGDSINGFARAFDGGGFDAQIRFVGSEFNLFSGPLSPIQFGEFGDGVTLSAASSSQNFFYLHKTTLTATTSSFALYYDEDGFGTGAAHQLVATFDEEVNLDASNIYVSYPI